MPKSQKPKKPSRVNSINEKTGKLGFRIPKGMNASKPKFRKNGIGPKAEDQTGVRKGDDA